MFNPTSRKEFIQYLGELKLTEVIDEKTYNKIVAAVMAGLHDDQLGI